MVILHKGLFGDGRGDLERPLRCPNRSSTWSLGLTWLPPKCRRGRSCGAGLDESDQPTGTGGLTEICASGNGLAEICDSGKGLVYRPLTSFKYGEGSPRMRYEITRGRNDVHSFSVSSFSSSLSSPVPPSREERRRSNDSSGNQSVPESSSSGVMTGAEAKVLQALEVMKSFHDFDSTIFLESLGSVRKRFSIPNEYVLHTPSFRRAGDPYRGGQGGARSLSEAGVGDSVGQKKKDRRRSPHKIDIASKGKGPADTSVEPQPQDKGPTFDAPLDPHLRPLTHGTPVWQSREASTTYIRGVLLPRLASNPYTLPSEVLMDEAAKAMVLVSIFSGFSCILFFFHFLLPDHSVSRTTLSGGLVRPSARRGSCDHFPGREDVPPAPGTLRLKEGGNPDAVVAAEVQAVEAQSVAERLRIELDEANSRRASVEAELEKSRSESASLERQLADLWERLGDSEGQLRSARARRAIEEYKESLGFEMGLIRMGRVSLEYGYQLALARLQARHPRVEIELDPFVTLPKDADVTMAYEQPFDDSLSPPEE
ncbi:hypothetical protein B296_00041598 [Ensete ventricosum]|uniref:Uncharacterized protein n=1 Tax=Ensete ventricosum TaxID=4639 RepID=A0A426XLF7_ENSVE|nr:hypothetical protein B296_00041598 [Ensete ventricosum]